jgi:hypothetical protein
MPDSSANMYNSALAIECAANKKRRVSTDRQTGERVWAIVYVAVVLERQQNSVQDPTKTFYEEAEEEADRAREAWFKRLDGGQAR